MLVLVQLGGGGPGQLRDVVQPDAGVGVHHDLDACAGGPAARTSSCSRSNPASLHDRFQHALQLAGRRPGVLLGAGGGHGGLLLCLGDVRCGVPCGRHCGGTARVVAVVRQGIAPPPDPGLAG